jgi:phosphoribosylformylglycinamidine synthase
MSKRVAVLVYPGTNSEDETERALRAAGLDAHLWHWSRGKRGLAEFDAYVLPGGFAYEDRIRGGAVAAHDEMTDAVIEAAAAGKFVIGICNGAQILLESGLVPGTGPVRLPTAAFAPNASGRFRSVLVHVKVACDPARSPLVAALPAGAVIPAWASHGEGRLAASAEELARIEDGGHLAFVYCESDGRVTQAAVPNGSALGCAGLVNAAGNVLALMPHPERICWTYQQQDGAAFAAMRREPAAALAPAGGSAFFSALAAALEGKAARA